MNTSGLATGVEELILGFVKNQVRELLNQAKHGPATITLDQIRKIFQAQETTGSQFDLSVDQIATAIKDIVDDPNNVAQLIKGCLDAAGAKLLKTALRFNGKRATLMESAVEASARYVRSNHPRLVITDSVRQLLADEQVTK